MEIHKSELDSVIRLYEQILLLLWFYSLPCKYANINLEIKMQIYSHRNENCNYSNTKLHNGRLIKASIWRCVLKTDSPSLRCLRFMNVCLSEYNDHANKSNTIIPVPNEPKLCFYSLNDPVSENWWLMHLPSMDGINRYNRDFSQKSRT